MITGIHLSKGFIRRIALRFVLAGALFVPPLGYAALSAIETSANLRVDLNQLLDEQSVDYESHLETVKRADRYLNQTAEPPQELVIKTRMIEALANFRLSRFDLSTQQFAVLCPLIDPSSFPDLSFRCLSMRAALKLILGDREGSLAGYESLLSADSGAVSAGLQARAQINYAAVLSENGRSAEAADIYEQQMVVAISEQDDALALYAANNLIVILITQDDYLAARETLVQLSEVLERNPDSLVRWSLQLHDFELTRVAGEIEAAISGLREFIEKRRDPMPLMMGSAHKLLADALRDKGELADALTNANKAVEILSPQVNETTEARFTRARILMDLRRYDAVLAELSRIDIANEGVPARRVRGYALELEARLRKSGDTYEAGALLALLAADKKRDQLASTTRSEYFNARLTAARRGLELQQSEAAALAAVEQNRVDKRSLNLMLALVGFAALAICLLVYLHVKRQAEHQLRLEKEAQNLELEANIAAKTRELTANLQAQAEMGRALDRKKRAESIGLLAGNVAHDFNNLLQVIASGNEALANPAISVEEKSKVLDISKRSLNHSSRIIRQLLAYSRQQDLASYPVHFGEYLRNTVALFHSAAGEQNLLEIEDNSNGAAVLVDPAQLTTSMLNLISNSSDAMPNGGRMTLTAEVRELDAEQAQRWNDLQAGRFLVLGLRDTGTGMTAEQVTQASEPFFTTKSLQFGTGLGLSSVYGFVKQSGGDLVIHSDEGEGTLIQILLPLTEEHSQPDKGGDALSSVRLPGRRVLLVEDNDSVATLLESVLAHLDLRTERASSGQEAKDILEKDAGFDYVLSDVRMPGGLDGPALARWIRRELPDVRVLLMSGFNELGPEDVDLPLISKPFSIDQLKRFMSEHSEPVPLS